MPIPDFNSNGLIPPFVGGDATVANRSPYFVPITDLCTQLGTTNDRRKLLRNLIQYRELLTNEGYTSGIQFIDGSFVENIELVANRSPNDIDLFSVLSLPEKYKGAPPEVMQLGGEFWTSVVADREANKARYQLDTYALLVEEVPLGALLHQVMYWQSLFSHQRDSFAWKGFVALHLDANADKAALQILEGA